MQYWFWYFLVYSFLGFCLETLYAAATRAPRRGRKCFLLLPLCPVYGLAMTIVVALVPPDWSLVPTAAAGALICTGTEYGVHWFYQTLFAVRFWDYSALGLNLKGRVCLRFSAAWGVLSALGLRLVQPQLALLADAVPLSVSAWMWLLFTADCALSGVVLLQYHDTALLSLPAAVRQLRASSQSSTSR